VIGAQQALDHWVALKGGDPDKVVLNAVVSGWNTGNFGPYGSLLELTGAQPFEIATFTWPSDLQLVPIGGVVGPEFPMTYLPVPGTLLVRADGIPVRDWIYDPKNNSVRFGYGGGPAPGSLVTVEYVEDCEGVPDGCSDGLDNDGDGLVDYPEEPGCTAPHDPNEVDPVSPPVCANGLDDDGDGDTDHPGDGECSSAAWSSETCTEVAEGPFGYRLCEEVGAATVCPDLSAGTPLAISGDQTVTVPLGFDFEFYNEDYAYVYVGANGTLHFDLPLSPPSNRCLPTPVMDRSVMVWWDDLEPASGGVWTRTSGVAPNRRFEVHWRALHVTGGGLLDFRATLQEGTDEITLCYVDTEAGVGASQGGSATVGIQGLGAAGIEASCLDPSLGNGDVLRFLRP